MTGPRSAFPNAWMFIATSLVCVCLGWLALSALAIMIRMYSPGLTAWPVAACAVLLPALWLNRSLTRAFRKIHTPDAPEWPSFFGALAVVSVPILVAMYVGALGLPGLVALDEAGMDFFGALGLYSADIYSPASVFPCADTDGYRISACDVGLAGYHRVIARNGSGVLKAMAVPAAGEVLDCARPAYVTGIDGDSRRIDLFMDPALGARRGLEHSKESRVGEAAWRGRGNGDMDDIDAIEPLSSGDEGGNGGHGTSSLVIGSGRGRPSLVLSGPTSSLVIY